MTTCSLQENRPGGQHGKKTGIWQREHYFFEGCRPCAQAPGRYLWLRRRGGCAHSIFEIVSNSIDEARDGHGDTINVTRCKDGSVIVEDFGRGMPVDWNNGEGRYNWELLFCEMYAGGNTVRARTTTSSAWA